MSDIHETLELWGAWAASDNSNVDFSPIAAGFKGLLPQTSRARPQCSDDDGIMIDGCVARLKKYNPEEYKLIILHFVCRVSLRKIARAQKCSDGKIRRDLQTAIGFINGLVCYLSEVK